MHPIRLRSIRRNRGSSPARRCSGRRRLALRFEPLPPGACALEDGCVPRVCPHRPERRVMVREKRIVDESAIDGDSEPVDRRLRHTRACVAVCDEAGEEIGRCRDRLDRRFAESPLRSRFRLIHLNQSNALLRNAALRRTLNGTRLPCRSKSERSFRSEITDRRDSRSSSPGGATESALQKHQDGFCELTRQRRGCVERGMATSPRGRGRSRRRR